MNNSVFIIIFLFFLFSNNLYANCLKPLTLKNDNQKFRDCLISLAGLDNLRLSSNTDSKDPTEIINLLTAQRPGSPHLKKISDEARVVFFDNKLCDLSPVAKLPCHRIGKLSLLHTDGRFENNYNCESYNPNQQNCRFIAQPLAAIVNKSDYCNHNSRNKYNCIALITGILDLDACQTDVSECQKVVETEFKKHGPEGSECDVRDKSFRVFGEDPYAGCLDGLPRSGRNTPVNMASANPDEGDDFANYGGGGSGDYDSFGGGGDGSAVDPTSGNEVTNADGDQLGQMANQLGQNMFGGGMGMGMMNQRPSPTQVPTSSPESNASLDGFAGPQGLSDARMANIPQGSVHLPLAANLPFQTGGRPGPRDQANSGNKEKNAGQNPPMMGGMGGGGQGASAGGGGGANKAKRGGGGYRRSAWQDTADKLGGNNYMGTDGAPGGSKVEPAQSAVPKKLRQKIAQNREADQARARVNASFLKNMPGGAAGGQQVYRSFQFPSVNKAFDTVYRDQNYYRESN